MLPSSSQSPHKNHTVVLTSRISQTSKPLILGSKQEHIYPARGSPPRARDHPVPRSMLPARARAQRPHKDDYTNTSREGNLLVRFGIDNVAGRMVARVLTAFMLFQPVYVALGMELENVPVETVSSAFVEENSTSEAVVEDSEDYNNTDEEVLTDSTPEYSDENSEEVTSESEVPTTEETDTAGTGSENDETEEGDTLLNEDVASSTEDVASTTEDVASTTEETASTTEEMATSSENVVAVTQDSENKYIFSEGDCTLVAEGEFYCVADGPERQTTGDPRVYSEKDREGDKEIYYFDGVEVNRITNNSYDDFAPVFDEETMRIVWQAMVQDRLQIMLYDIPTNTTRQITTSRQNSSNPSILRDTVVWQEWVDTNWEIMTTTIGDPDQEFIIERLTDNMVHDMFPAVYDDLLTWQSERGSSWEVVVYDLKTGKRQSLEKNEDTKYENPRFVLLFDSKHDNGDVETIGYSLDTGEKMELGTKANPQPIVPVTPKEKVPEASITSSNSTLLKEGDDAGGAGDGDGGTV